jgi:hypothetical protein
MSEPTGEATKYRLCFAVVAALVFIFRVFSPKIACQVQKPPKSLKQNKIELAF